MTSTQGSDPVPTPVPVPPSASVLTSVPVRPVPVRPAAARAAAAWGRAPRPAAPATARRDGARPGARPARFEGVTAVRPVRGGCPTGAVGRKPGERGTRTGGRAPAPVRLTERGRRVVAGLSMVIGLSIAAGTVVTVELGNRHDGLELAGASTVVIRPGDTLWTLAREMAPEEDPRAVVDAIVDLNGLDSVDLVPGMELQLP